MKLLPINQKLNLSIEGVNVQGVIKRRLLLVWNFRQEFIMNKVLALKVYNER